VLGYYDQESKELRVRAGQLSPFGRTVIVHELTHALDDQRFDLNRPQYDSSDDEIGFGFTALAEGNARRIENAYRNSMSTADKASATAEELKLGASGAAVLAKLKLSLLQLELAPYDLGERFVDAVLDKGGQAALDGVFADPPRTSEQVIDPAKYFAKEPSREVNPPKADRDHPPCPTKWGPPPGHSKVGGKHHPCGKAKGQSTSGKGTKGGIILVLPMTLMSAAYAVRPQRLRLRRRSR